MYNQINMPLLIKELKENEPSRRYKALILIGECKKIFNCDPNEELLELAIPFLDDEDTHVRYYAAEAIGKLGMKSGLDYLEEVKIRELSRKVEKFGPSPLQAITKSIKILREK